MRRFVAGSQTPVAKISIAKCSLAYFIINIELNFQFTGISIRREYIYVNDKIMVWRVGRRDGLRCVNSELIRKKRSDRRNRWTAARTFPSQNGLQKHVHSQSDYQIETTTAIVRSKDLNVFVVRLTIETGKSQFQTLTENSFKLKLPVSAAAAAADDDNDTEATKINKCDNREENIFYTK